MRPEELDRLSSLRIRIRETLDRIAADELEWERSRVPPVEVIRRLGREGLIGLHVQGDSRWHEVVLAEELAHHALGWTLSVLAHSCMAVPLLAEVAPEHELLAKAITGEAIIALAVTEPDSGSDLSRTTTTYREGRVVGAKRWITNGSIATHALVLARSDRLCLCLVDTGASGYRAQQLDMGGLRSGDTAVIDLDAQAELLDGNAYYAVLKGLQWERLIAGIALNELSKRVLADTKEHLKRERGGRRLFDHQVIRHRLAALAARLDASTQLAYACVDALERSVPADREIVSVKIVAYELAREVIDACAQLHGASACEEDHWLNVLRRESQIFTLASGTAEIMRELRSSL